MRRGGRAAPFVFGSGLFFGHRQVFSYAECKRFFDFSRPVPDAAHGLRSPASRIGFLRDMIYHGC